MNWIEIVTGFLTAAIGVGTPLLLAAIGEMITERSGVINLGVEGAMLAGALGAAVGAASGGVVVGIGGGIVGGAIAGLIFAAATVGARADQIIAGAAVTLLSIGVTGMLFRRIFSVEGPGLSIPTLQKLEIPGFSQIPIVGSALFGQSIMTYLALILVPISWWFLNKSWWGLALRACGESALAAKSSGIPVGAVRAIAIMTGSGLAGLAGTTLVMAQVGTFTEKMTAGRGFIAIAIVVLGRWQPISILFSASLFGSATALQFLFQAMGTEIPYQLFLAFPYLLALAVLAGASRLGQHKSPGELGRN